MNCILFLDFDGVTHPDPCRKDEYFRQLPLIEGVLRKHISVNVVISSSWRYDHRLPELQAFFSSDVRTRVVDVTPSVARTDDEGWIPRDLLQHHREWECRKWMRQNRPLDTSWLAIDDAAEWFTPECAHLLTTQSSIGFQEEQEPLLSKMIKQRL
jgi:HAD domain in Swiss Army Knife RNA repair proteins